MPTLTVQLPDLRRDQWTLFQSFTRWNVWVCHRRMGKTTLCLYMLLREAFRNTQARPRYAYVAPLYRQAKAIAWDTLKYFVQYIPDARVNEQELRVDFPQNGARIQLLGADSPDTLRGLYLDGAVLDEYAQMQPRAWREVIRPALADRTGWAIWIGTPNGRNHFYDVAMRAQERQAAGDVSYSYRIFRASETGILSPAELVSAREAMQDFEYQQEFECSWTAPVPGSYYQEEFAAIERQGRIRPLVYDPYYPTCTAWDLGYADSNAIWYFQPKGNEVHFIDYDEGNSIPLAPPDYPQPGANLDNNWLAIVRSKPYIYDYSRLAEPQSREPYERHFGPHDLEQTEYGSGKTRYGIALYHPMERYRLRFTVVPRGPIQDRIEAARRLLSRAVFDEERCARGLDALRAYRREWNETAQSFANHPYHSWASHGADAFSYAAVGMSGEPAHVEPVRPGNSFLWAREQAKRQREGRLVRTFRK